MKFLKTIRFDPSDGHVFEHPANPDEWAIPGGFIFANFQEQDIKGKLKQAFSNGFLSLDSFGNSTFVSIAEIEQPTIDVLQDRLAQYFIDELGAPDAESAKLAAKAEVQFVLDMCQDVGINSVFSLNRFFEETGEIREEFRIVDTHGAKPHARVWEVVED